MLNLNIEITEDEFEHLAQIAELNGFETPEAYVKALALEPTKEELLNDIREGIITARRGDKMPTLDEMWSELERDDDDETSG